MILSKASGSQPVSLTVRSGSNQFVVQGIVDTGATHSFLSKHVAEALNIQVVGIAKVQSLNGIIQVEQSFVDITYKQQEISRLLVIVGDAPFDFLVGLDVIARIPSILFDAFPSITEESPLPANVVKSIVENAFRNYEQQRSAEYIRDVLFGDLFVGGVIGGVMSYLLITFGSFLFGLTGFGGLSIYVMILVILFALVLVGRSKRSHSTTR